jgi:hypothetical protein
MTGITDRSQGADDLASATGFTDTENAVVARELVRRNVPKCLIERSFDAESSGIVVDA